MMESLRNAGKTWVAKVLLVLLALSFAVWGIEDMFGGMRGSTLATVGNQSISSQEYSDSFQRALQDLARRGGEAMSQEEARKRGYDKVVLNQLVEGAALDEQAQRLDIRVSAQAVVDATQNAPAFRGSDGKFDPQAFQGVLRQNGLTEAGFLAAESRNRSRLALTSSINAGFKPPQVLVEALTRYREEQRDAKYFLITATEADVPPPADQDIKAQYEVAPAAYTAPEFRSIAVMKAEPADLAAKITITEDELKAGYEKHKSEFYTPERRTVLQIPFDSEADARAAKARIDQGTDFLSIARERKVTDADLTLADRAKSGFLDKEIADAAFSLKQGEVSGVVKGGLVTALLKVQGITPEKQATLDEVREPLKLRLQTERAQDEIQSIFDAVENARNAQTKFEDIAKAQGIPFMLAPRVSAAGLDPQGKEVDLPNKQEILKAAFASDVGLENEPLHPDSGYFWFEVREVAPSALKPLDAVREQVKADVIAKKLRELLADRAAKIVASLKASGNFEQEAAAAKAEVKQSSGLRRNEATQEFDGASLTALFSAPPSGFAWNLEGDGRSAKIIQSLPVIAAPFDPKSPLSLEVAKGLSSGTAGDLAAAYVSDLKGDIGVSVNDQLWQQVAGTTATKP